MPTLFASIIVIAVSLAAFLLQTNNFQVFTSESKRRLDIEVNPQALELTHFQTHFDDAIDWREFEGKFIIVDFIYTRCMTVCSVLGAEFLQIQREAADLIAAEKLQLLSISFDAANDQPEQLHAYIKRFSDDTYSWQGLRVPDDQQRQSLLEQFGVVVLPDGRGDFIHNASLHLVSPAGSLMKIVDYTEAKSLIAEIRTRLNNKAIEEESDACHDCVAITRH